MSQANFTIGADKPGLTYRIEDNAGKQAIVSSHIGSSRPSYAVQGTFWLDNTGTPWIWNFYDGTDDIQVGTLNASTNAFLVDFNLVGDTTPQLGGFLDPNGNYIGRDKGGDLASADPLVIDADGDMFNVTGTEDFADMTVATNRNFTLQFDGVLTVTDGATIILPGGANFTTAAGDIFQCQSIAADTVLVTAITKADGTPVISAGGGEWKFVTTHTLSADATLDITDIDSSRKYFYKLFTSDDAAQIFIRTDANNGVSFDAGASDYAYGFSGTANGGAGNQDQANSEIRLTEGVGNDTQEFATGELILINPTDTDFTRVYSRIGYSIAAAGDIEEQGGYAERASAAIVNALQFNTNGTSMTGFVDEYEQVTS